MSSSDDDLRNARDFRPVPVLADAVLETPDLQPGHILVDCTLGLAGHSRMMLERVAPTGRLIATDFDPRNIEFAREQLKQVVGGNFVIHNTNFAALPNVLAAEGVERVDAI